MRKQLCFIAVLSCLAAILTGCSILGLPDERPGARNESTNPNADKEFTGNMQTFSCEYHVGNIVGSGDIFFFYNYSYEASLQADGSVTCEVLCSRDYGESGTANFTTDASLMTDLQTILTKNDELRRNGNYGHTNGLPECGGSMKATYDNGQELYMADNASVPFSQATMVDLCTLFEERMTEAGCMVNFQITSLSQRYRNSSEYYTNDDWRFRRYRHKTDRIHAFFPRPIATSFATRTNAEIP